MSDAPAVPIVRSRRRPPGWVADGVAAAVAAALLIGAAVRIPAGAGGRKLDVLGYLLLVVAALSMGACRRWPRLATAAVTVVLCVFVARRYPDGPVWITGPAALAALAWKTSRRGAALGAVVLLAALSATAAVAGRVGVVEPAVYLGWSAAALLLGDALRNRRTYLAGLAERARFLERSRAEEAARRVAEERLRIARDLHDSVAHAMATINVQAGAAAHVLARRPEAAGAALEVIQRASGEVLDELGAMLSLLRDDTQRAERAPTPGIAGIARLAEATGASGLSVSLEMHGAAEAVPAVVGTAAYRVVQESMTNVLRHSQARTVQVRVQARPGAGLLVEVGDPGPAAGHVSAGTGVGIRGMRERVTATGGDFAAGPAAGGGFQVRAAWAGRA